MQVGVHPRLQDRQRGRGLPSSEAWASKSKAQAISASKRASIASRAAATRSRGATRAEFRADEDRGAALGLLAFHEAPLGPDESPGQGVSAVKTMRSPFGLLLTPAVLQMLHAPSRRSRSGGIGFGSGERAPSAASISSISSSSLDGNDAVRRQALDRERPGDADAGLST